ncbi:MAG: response regulator [Ferruginibacter sp.]
MKSPVSFIIIDDDSTNNLLCSIVIEDVMDSAKIKAFQYAEKGLNYIKTEYANLVNPTILFLDINMPTWSGWDFLEQFEEIDAYIKDQFKIYMLSSSLDPGDQQRALANKYVRDYIEKPLSEEALLSILKGYKQEQ